MVSLIYKINTTTKICSKKYIALVLKFWCSCCGQVVKSRVPVVAEWLRVADHRQMVRAQFPPPGTRTLRTILNCIIVLLSCSVRESPNESSKDFFSSV